MLLNGPIAEAIAGRYRARGIESDDLLQVAYLGLVKASQGYRAAEGPGFLAHVEIAESLGVTVGEFREVEMAAGSYNALSLDAPDHEATGPAWPTSSSTIRKTSSTSRRASCCGPRWRT